jgi:hypothetical protein
VLYCRLSKVRTLNKQDNTPGRVSDADQLVV